MAELAALLGRRRPSLYPHLRALERVALVRRTGTRRNGKSDAALYAVPAPRMMIEYRLGSPTFVADMARTSRSLLRLTERDFRRALRSPAAAVQGPRRNLWATRTKARLGAPQLERLNDLFSNVLEELAACQGSREGRLHALTFAIAPLEER